MVFFNVETNRYYHGLGREVTLKMTGEYTKVDNIIKYIEKPLLVNKNDN